MEVPLLSIIPIPNLKIKDAELDFSTEVLMSQDASGHAGATARICPSNEQSAAKRSTVNYKIRLKSADETEGYMRILDVLNLCPVAKQTEACPVSPDGRALPENKEAFLRTRLLKKQEAALCRLYQEIETFAQAKENLSPDAAACCMNEDADDAEKYEAMKQSVAAELFTIKEALLNEKANTILRGGNDLE